MDQDILMFCSHFVRQYYEHWWAEPEALHHFYLAGSSLTHGMEKAQGAEEIQKVLATTGSSEPRRTQVLSRSYQPGVAEFSFLVQVVGKMTFADGRTRSFAQTFCIARKSQSEDHFYVHNDIFMFVGEEERRVESVPVSVAATNGHQAAEEEKVVVEEAEVVVKKEQAKVDVSQPAPVAQLEEAPQPSAPVKKVPKTWSTLVSKGGANGTAPKQVKPLGKRRGRLPVAAQTKPAPSAKPVADPKHARSNGRRRSGNKFVAFVSNIAKGTQQRHIRTALAVYGEIAHVAVKTSERRKGSSFAFVEFVTAEGLEKCLSAKKVVSQGQTWDVERKTGGKRRGKGQRDSRGRQKKASARAQQ